MRSLGLIGLGSSSASLEELMPESDSSSWPSNGKFNDQTFDRSNVVFTERSTELSDYIPALALASGNGGLPDEWPTE